MRKLVLGAALLMGAASIAGFGTATATTQTTVVVTPADMGNHWFAADTRAPGTGTFEVGPASPPAGIGSFELNTPVGPPANPGQAKVQLFTDLYNGVKLIDIDGIGYSTYRSAAAPASPAVAALNIRVDVDGNGSADAYMVYEPYQDGGVVADNVWQSWDAYRGGNARWWINTGAAGCGQSTPCTWAAIVSAFPNATVREAANCGPGGVTAPCPGSLGVNQGSYNAGTISNADALYVSVGGNQTTYDFEPYRVATNKDQCKDGGWKNVKRADGSAFKNQGDCVSYTNTGK